MKIYLALAAAALVTGCANAPIMVGTPKSIAYSADTCASYGFKPGTPDHAYCVQNSQAQLRGQLNFALGTASAYSATIQPKTYNVHVNRY